MKEEIKCKNCNTKIVVIENKLFFPDEKLDTSVSCPICNHELFVGKTDGWFFVQTQEEFFKELEIEKKKECLTYPMA